MQPEERVCAKLWDMLQAAGEARAMCEGFSYDEIAKDRRTLLALERLMEILGECARGVPAEFRFAHDTIPWRALIGMRNVLAHEYGSIDHKRLYLAATVDGAALCVEIERLLSDR